MLIYGYDRQTYAYNHHALQDKEIDLPVGRRLMNKKIDLHGRIDEKKWHAMKEEH